RKSVTTRFHAPQPGTGGGDGLARLVRPRGSGLGAGCRSAKPATPNSRITMGVIGSGDRSKALLGDAHRQKKFQVVAVCDVDRNHREEVAKKVTKDFGGDCAKYEDFRQLCDRKDIDCVIVATPDH